MSAESYDVFGDVIGLDYFGARYFSGAHIYLHREERPRSRVPLRELSGRGTTY